MSASFLVAHSFGHRAGGPPAVPLDDVGEQVDDDASSCASSTGEVRGSPAPRTQQSLAQALEAAAGHPPAPRAVRWTGIMNTMSLKVMELSGVALAWAAAMGSSSINDYLEYLRSQRRQQLAERDLLEARLRQRVFAAVSLLLVQLPASMQMELRRRVKHGGAVVDTTGKPLFDTGGTANVLQPPPHVDFAAAAKGASTLQAGVSAVPPRDHRQRRALATSQPAGRATLPAAVVDLLQLPPPAPVSKALGPRFLQELMGGGFVGAPADAHDRRASSPHLHGHNKPSAPPERKANRVADARPPLSSARTDWEATFRRSPLQSSPTPPSSGLVPTPGQGHKPSTGTDTREGRPGEPSIGTQQPSGRRSAGGATLRPHTVASKHPPPRSPRPVYAAAMRGHSPRAASAALGRRAINRAKDGWQASPRPPSDVPPTASVEEASEPMPQRRRRVRPNSAAPRRSAGLYSSEQYMRARGGSVSNAEHLDIVGGLLGIAVPAPNPRRPASAKATTNAPRPLPEDGGPVIVTEEARPETDGMSPPDVPTTQGAQVPLSQPPAAVTTRDTHRRRARSASRRKPLVLDARGLQASAAPTGTSTGRQRRRTRPRSALKTRGTMRGGQLQSHRRRPSPVHFESHFSIAGASLGSAGGGNPGDSNPVSTPRDEAFDGGVQYSESNRPFYAVFTKAPHQAAPPTTPRTIERPPASGRARRLLHAGSSQAGSTQATQPGAAYGGVAGTFYQEYVQRPSAHDDDMLLL